MCYNRIVKKFVIILLVGILIFNVLIFAGCDNKNIDDEDKEIFLTVSFDANGISCTLPEPKTFNVSKEEIVLPIPDDVPQIAGCDPAWFVDKECTILFDSSTKPSEDLNITVYLGYAPKTYSVTYTNKEDFDFEGEFKESYVFGKGVSLPNIDMGKGYQKYGNWYFGEDEKDFYTTAIPTTAMGDLVLTFKPNPIKYNIVYIANLPEGEEMDNPNILTYDVTMEEVVLLPATAEGKTFSHWEYRSVMSKNKKVETLNLDLFLDSMSFSLWAIWE